MNARARWAGVWLLAAVWAAPAAVLREIRVVAEGPVAVDRASVLAYLTLREGQENLDEAELSRALAQNVKELNRSGRFSYVDAALQRRPDGLAVVVRVIGKPRLARLEVEGADTLGNRRVRELLGVSLGDPVDDTNLAVGARKVRDEYLKKYFPSARVEWDSAISERDGNVTVRVRVAEGARARVRYIEFAGHAAVPESELRSRLQQQVFRPWNPWHWLVGRGRMNPDDVDGDVYRLRRAYADRGYLDARVGEPDITPVGKDRVRLRFPIEEGPLYRLGAVSLSGATLFPTNQLLGLVTNRPGEAASLAAIEGGAEAIRAYYGNRGYVRSDAQPRLDADPATRVVRVRYEVTEGRQGYVRDIRFRGQNVTQDKVMRRELVAYPGEKYNRSRIRTSERRLLNLGYFSSVRAALEDTPEADVYDVVFDVEEQRMGQAAAGIGFSTIDEISGYFEISHGNFNIREWPPVGAGQKAKLRATLGTRRRDIEASFVEPWFLDRKLSLGVDLFHREKSYLSDEYDQRNTGGAVTLAKPLGRWYRLSLKYGLEQISIYNVDEDASARIREEEGDRLKSAATLALTRDTRDQTFIPTRGNRTVLSATLAGGPLGAETDFYQLDARTAQYVPLWWSHVLILRGWMGTIEEFGDSTRVPIFDRYFIGGANSVRGFKYRDIGPRDETGEALGGRSMTFLSAEYTIRLSRVFRVAGFYDAGMVWTDAFNWESDFNSGAGLGLRFDLPMFPLRLDYAWPLETDEVNDRASGRFSFTMGYGF